MSEHVGENCRKTVYFLYSKFKNMQKLADGDQDGWTESRTDGRTETQTDGHHLTIIRPD